MPPRLVQPNLYPTPRSQPRLQPHPRPSHPPSQRRVPPRFHLPERPAAREAITRRVRAASPEFHLPFVSASSHYPTYGGVPAEEGRTQDSGGEWGEGACIGASASACGEIAAGSWSSTDGRPMGEVLPELTLWL